MSWPFRLPTVFVPLLSVGVLAFGLALALVPRLEPCRRLDSTETSVQQIRSVVTMYLAEHPTGPCPGVTELVGGGYLDADKSLRDAWERPFRIQCGGTRVRVVSAGHDGIFGTEDDID